VCGGVNRGRGEERERLCEGYSGNGWDWGFGVRLRYEDVGCWLFGAGLKTCGREGKRGE